MKQLLTMLSVLTLAGGAVVTSVYPINNAVNIKNEQNISEAPIIAETKQTINTLFDDFGKMPEFSANSTYSSAEGVTLPGNEYLKIAKEKTLDLLSGFSSTGKKTSKDLMEYLTENVPDFKDSVNESKDQLENLNIPKEDDSEQTIQIASLVDFQRYLDSLDDSIRDAKILEIEAKNVTMALSVTAAGFWITSIFLHYLVPVAVMITGFSVLTGIIGSVAGMFATETEDVRRDNLNNGAVSGAIGLAGSYWKLSGLIDKIISGASRLSVVGSCIGAVVSVATTTWYDMRLSKEYKEWLEQHPEDSAVLDYSNLSFIF